MCLSAMVQRENVEALRCSPEVKEGLVSWAGRVTRALAEELVGMYLYGSLAHGCYHPAASDVDVLVVTGGPSSEAAISKTVKAHEEAAVAVDATFVTRSQIDVDETPTPVDFVIKPAGDERPVRPREGLGDFLLQRQDVHECGVTLAGRPARDVVRPVPWQALARSLDYLFPHIVPRFKNPVLMLCRVAYAFANRSLCSKRTAGQWALGVLDEEWRPLIEESLAKYAGGVPDDRGPDDRLRAFEGHCAEYVALVRADG